MTRPGTRLRALSARVCSERLMERLIDPAIADLQAEHEEAVRRGCVWKSCWVLLTGYLAWAKVMALCGWLGVRQDLHDWTPEDWRTLRGTMWTAATITIAATVLLEMTWLPWLRATKTSAVPLVYLIPSTLRWTVPAGLTLGMTLRMGGRTISRRLVAALLTVGLAWSVASFLNLAWVVPAASLAFNEAIIGQGIPEREREQSLAELRRSSEELVRWQEAHPEVGNWAAEHAHRMSFGHHARFTFAGAPLTLAAFAVVLLTRRRFTRAAATITGFAGVAGYVLLEMAGSYFSGRGVIPPPLGAWLPHIPLVVASVALLRLRGPSEPRRVVTGPQ